MLIFCLSFLVGYGFTCSLGVGAAGLAAQF